MTKNDEKRQWVVKCPICDYETETNYRYSRNLLEDEYIQIEDGKEEKDSKILQICDDCIILYYSNYSIDDRLREAEKYAKR